MRCSAAWLYQKVRSKAISKNAITDPHFNRFSLLSKLIDLLVVFMTSGGHMFVLLLEALDLLLARGPVFLDVALNLLEAGNSVLKLPLSALKRR